MKPRATLVAAAVVALTFVGGCNSSRHSARTVQVAEATPTTGAAAGPVLLAAFDTGVGGVAVGATSPLWRETNAVASADGTSVFVVRHGIAGEPDRLVRLEPANGNDISSWTLATPNLSVAAVAPKARWIALTDHKPGYGRQDHTATKLVVFDTRAGKELHKLTLTGDVQPEAFSVDGAYVFALHYLADHYRVQTIDLATGMRYDTSDRDKLPPEDMHGQAVHGVMSTDRTLLATLYRNPTDAAEPAFVHVLDLQHDWSYCADLPAPFGTGAPGTDVIELTRADTVVITATDADRIAEVHIDDVRVPGFVSGKGAVRVSYRAGTVDSPDAPFRSLPGFEYVFVPPGT